MQFKVRKLSVILFHKQLKSGYCRCATRWVGQLIPDCLWKISQGTQMEEGDGGGVPMGPPVLPEIVT